MTKVHWFIISPNTARSKRLVKVLNLPKQFVYLGCWENLSQAHIANPDVYRAKLVLIDLTYEITRSNKFWLAFRLGFPMTKVVALVNRHLTNQSVLTALQSAVYCYIAWVEARACLQEAIQAAFEERRFYSDPWLIAAIQKIIKAHESGDRSRTDIPSGNNTRRMIYMHLSPLERNLLNYFFQRKGQVVSAQELAYNVWHQEKLYDIDDQVNCCVRRLRNKLLKIPQSGYSIRTIRSQGYCLTIEEDRIEVAG